MKRVPINFTDIQHRILKKEAYESNKSMSDIIRKALDEYISRKKTKTGRENINDDEVIS